MIMVEDNTTTTNGANDDSKQSARIDETVEPMATAIDPNMALSVPPADPLAEAPKAVAQPSATAQTSHDDETEYERIQRLKLNADEAPHSGAINADIAQILKEVKLPERRDFKASADVQQAPAAAPAKPAPEVKKDDATPPKRDIVTALHTLKDDLQDVVLLRRSSTGLQLSCFLSTS